MILQNLIRLLNAKMIPQCASKKKADGVGRRVLQCNLHPPSAGACVSVERLCCRPIPMNTPKIYQ